MWVKHAFETTNVLYKACLKDWYKGTGGGPGIDNAFETWDDEMRTKYNVEPETYDHTDVSSRPIVLFHNYTKNRVPFLTVIRMWDQTCDYLLSSKHDPLKIGSGELGFEDTAEDCSQIVDSNPSSPAKATKKRKKVSSTSSNGGESTDLSAMLSTVVNTCKGINAATLDSTTTATTSRKSNSNVAIEDLPLDELYKLIAQHRMHLEFLKECGMCDDEKKKHIVSQCENIFMIINGRSSSSKSVSN